MKLMRKVLSVLVGFSLLLTISFGVFATDMEEESTTRRVPPGLVVTTGSGTQIEPEYTHTLPGTKRAIDDVVVIKGSTPGWPEINVGAHYYAFSPFTTTHEEAYTRVKLPTSYNNASGTRIGYISLGVFGSQGNLGIDLGLRNAGSGWHPYSYDVKGGNFIVYDTYTQPTAKDAVIVVTPLSTTKIRMYVQFKDASGNDVGNPFYEDINIAAGNLAMVNGVIACYYYRFASLINLPHLPDNQMDSSYMLGGNFNGLALYNRNTHVYENWGINTSLINQAWKVSPERIYFSYNSTTDYFDIDHWSY